MAATGIRVLIVDDDANQLFACAKLLERHCEVVTAATPAEALERVRNERFDVVLSDQVMPDMLGTQLLAAVRRLQPATRRVLTSAFVEAGGDVLQAINAGDVHRYVGKPVNPQGLLEDLAPARVVERVRCALIDVDEERARGIAEGLAGEGSLDVARARSSGEVANEELDLAILVEPESVRVAEQAIEALRRRPPNVARRIAVVVALPSDAGADSAGFMAAGADDLLWLPLRPWEVRLRYDTWVAMRSAQRETARVISEVSARSAFPEIVGDTDAMRDVFRQINRVAPSDASVLITGETGSGKSIIARALHALSYRRQAPFMEVNLSALPETLVESELFGHEKGAFTGARMSRQGRLEAVAGGTLFLDEIGDLSLNVQVKLLRMLEQRTFERVGSTTPRKADFRLVCATHRDLEAKVTDGTFREDLYYRINVIRIEMPSLRHRRNDIPVLAQHFLQRFSEKYKVAGASLNEEAIAALMRHDWPGNVRELQHMIERAVATSGGGQIDGELLWVRHPRVSFKTESQKAEDGRGLREVLADIERTMLVDTLERYGGNQVAASKKLKIPRATLQNRLKKYGL